MELAQKKETLTYLLTNLQKVCKNMVVKDKQQVKLRGQGLPGGGRHQSANAGGCEEQYKVQ